MKTRRLAALVLCMVMLMGFMPSLQQSILAGRQPVELTIVSEKEYYEIGDEVTVHWKIDGVSNPEVKYIEMKISKASGIPDAYRININSIELEGNQIFIIPNTYGVKAIFEAFVSKDSSDLGYHPETNYINIIPKITGSISFNPSANIVVGDVVTANWEILGFTPQDLNARGTWAYFDHNKDGDPSSPYGMIGSQIPVNDLTGQTGSTSLKTDTVGWLGFYFKILDGNYPTFSSWIQVVENPVLIPDPDPYPDPILNDDLVTGWVNDDGKWYYMNADSNMQTGWVNDDGKWYYMNTDGNMQTGWVNDGDNWHYLTPSGSMATGWIKDGDNWHYLTPSGVMATGWVKDGDNWHYLTPSGAMATDWVKDGPNWYYLTPSGAMATGWVKDGLNWYYLNSSGAMTNGTQTIDGKVSSFDSSGAWLGYK